MTDVESLSGPTFRMSCDLFQGLLPWNAVLIHGNLASNRWWQKTMTELQSREFAHEHIMIAGEWRGCGRTEGPASPQDLKIERLAMDYVQLLQRHKLEKVIAIGHSTGASIALVAAALAPEFFSGLVLLDPVAVDGVMFTPEMIAGFDLMKNDRSICEAVMATTIHGCDTQDPYFQKLVDDTMKTHDLVWREIPKILQHGTLDISAHVAQVTQPTLILHGCEDIVLPISGARQLAQVLKTAKLVEIPGHGHSLNVEDPKLFVDLMLEAFSQEPLAH